MSDKFVTVQRFNNSFKAQLAKNLLENEGIESMVSGEMAQDVMLGTGLHEIALQVHEDQAQRAAGILAAAEAEAELDDDWEDQAESGVWVCSICGEPISNRLSVCYSCQTPREAIRAGAPRDPAAIQRDPATSPTGEEVQQRDEITRTPAAESAPVASTAPLAEEEDERDQPSLGPADDLARHAFGAAFFGVLTILLLPISWYYLLRLMYTDDELTPKGIRYVYGALLVNGIFVLMVVALCAGGRVIHL